MLATAVIMAVSGHPHQDDSYLDFNPPSDSPYSPILETSSPESNSPSPGPVSPGKKRVRISDSTSVRVIEERGGDLGKFKVNNNHGFRARALRGLTGGEARSRDRWEKEALLDAGEYEEVEEEEGYGRGCGRSAVEYPEYTEFLYTVDQLTFPEDLPLDTDSLESRDNPFLPGGDLSKEAEELLQKATIVRDKFYLQQEQEKEKLLLESAEQRGGACPDPVPEFAGEDVVDRALLNASNNSAEILEDRICPSAVTLVEAVAAPSQLRENGKAGEGVASDTSPERVRLEVGDSPTADGRPGGVVVVVDADNEQQDKDKTKRRPKCCLLM